LFSDASAEGGQAAETRIHQQSDAAFRKRTRLGDHKREVVCRHGHGLGVEVAAGQHVSVFREQQRIVGHRICLALKDHRDVADLVEAGAHDLRLAAQAVRVLDPRTFDMGITDVAAAHQAPVCGGHGDLPGLTANFRNTRIEWHIAALGRIGGQCARHRRRGERVTRREHPLQRQRGRNLCAVQQRQAFLRAEHQRRQAGALQPEHRRQYLAVITHLANPQQHRRQMRQRREVAGRPDRALGRNDGIDFRLEQPQQRLDQRPPDARMTTRQRRGLQRQHQPDHVIRQRRADTGAVREHEVALQQRQFVLRNSLVREQSETGADAIDAPVLGHDPVDQGGCRIDAVAARLVQRHRNAASSEPPKLRQGNLPGGEGKAFGHRFRDSPRTHPSTGSG
jgi:hypothetical protein